MTPGSERPSRNTATQKRLEPVASYRHFIVFLGIVTLVALAGYMAQQRRAPDGELTESHAHVIPIYLSATAMNWLLVYFVWRGTRRHGTGLHELIRGRWAGVLDVARDVGIALGAWGVMLAITWTLGRLVGQGVESSVERLLPRTLDEVIVWLVTSASAGFCEDSSSEGTLSGNCLP